VVGDLEGALVGDLEPPHLLDGVAPELDAHRVLLGGREDVEDAAAHGELAAPLDEVGAGVGGRDERVDDVLERTLVAGAQRDGHELAETLGQRLEDRAHGRDHHRERAVCRVVRVGVGDPSQHGQPPTDGVAAGREALVRQGLPRREDGDPVGGEEETERAREVLGLARRRRDDDDGRGVGGGRSGRGGSGPVGLLGERGDEERARAVARGDVDETCPPDLVEDVADIGKRPEGGQQWVRHQVLQSRSVRRQP